MDFGAWKIKIETTAPLLSTLGGVDKLFHFWDVKKFFQVCQIEWSKSEREKQIL